jgi:hypothetical protein
VQSRLLISPVTRGKRIHKERAHLKVKSKVRNEIQVISIFIFGVRALARRCLFDHQEALCSSMFKSLCLPAAFGAFQVDICFWVDACVLSNSSLCAIRAAALLRALVEADESILSLPPTSSALY